MIDRDRFHEHFQYFDKEIVIEIIDIFISEFDMRFSNLNENVALRDFDKLKFNAHGIKGVIANFMDPDTIEHAKRLDEMAKNKIENGLEKAIADFESSAKLLLEELKQMKQKLSGS